MGDEGMTPPSGTPLTTEEQHNIDQLEAAGIIESEFLSDDTLRAIASLTQEEIDCLVGVAAKLKGVAFLKGRGPRFGI